MQRTLDSLNLRLHCVDSVRCPLCSLNITDFEVKERESHVESCLVELEISVEGSSSPKPVKKDKPKKSNEKEEEEEAEVEKEEKRPKRKKQPLRQLPLFKILSFDLKHPKPPIVADAEVAEEETIGGYDEMKFQVNVDGFNYTKHSNITHYFLSHFHSDHYIGLNKSWNKGLFIYTSRQTMNLSIWKFHLEQVKTMSLDFEKWNEIYRNKVGNDLEVVKVKLYDANHCPGGAIFLFEHSLNGNCVKRVLHTGDFRVSKRHILEFKDLFIDQIYLDTTYLNPKYMFLEQSKLVKKTGEFIRKKMFKDDKIQVCKPSILNFFNKSDKNNSWIILIGSYSIGKENLYLHLSKILNSRIFISRDKYEMLCKCFKREIMEKFFSVDEDCLIHVVPIRKLHDAQFINRNYHNRNIIKVKPTGWSFSQYLPNPNHKDLIRKTNAGEILTQGEKRTYLEKIVFNGENEIEERFEQNLEKMYKSSNSLSIPYSEHSNFKELSMFCGIVKWGEVIPTVMNNYGKFTKRKVDNVFDDKSGIKQDLKENIKVKACLNHVIVVDVDDDEQKINETAKKEEKIAINNDNDSYANEEGEFERWFRIWNDYEITIDQIEEYYG